MKLLYFLLLNCLFPLLLRAQEPTAIKIDQLDQYIKKSDHPLVISFWATWCGPCLREIPWMQAAVAQKKSYRVELVLVSLDYPAAFPDAISRLAREKQFEASLFWLNEWDAAKYCPIIAPGWKGGIPANLFVNNETGYRKFIGRQLTDRQAGQELNRLLGLPD